MKWTKQRILKTLKDLALGSHLTSLSVDSVDGHLLLCELCSSILPPSTPRVAAAYVTGVRTNLWSASAPCCFRTLFRSLCYRHRDGSFPKLNMERDESADNRRARVVLLEHAPCGSSVCLLQERQRSRVVVPRLATVRKHISGEQTVILVNTEPASCIVSPYQRMSVVCVCILPPPLTFASTEMLLTSSFASSRGWHVTTSELLRTAPLLFLSSHHRALTFVLFLNVKCFLKKNNVINY